MIYLVQRLIQNENQWTKPSPGRLGPVGEGEYVQENGFGHEDWNFNLDFAIDDYVYGYSYYSPSEDKQSEKFNFAFMIYVDGQWNLVGFYLDSEFAEEGSPLVSSILKEKMNHLRSLGDSLGNPWKRLRDRDFLAKLREEAQWLTWKVKAEHVLPTPRPIPLNDRIYSSKNYRITRPKEIDESTFKNLYRLALKSIPQEEPEEDTDFPEGKLVEKIHKTRERNIKVIALAKKTFLRKHGRLFCQVCEIDFGKKYGEIGKGFIETHHTVPVSDLKKDSKTNIKDIALVCPNCHRMLHRRRPWLSIGQLKDLISND